MQSSDLSTSGRKGRFPAHGRGSWRARRRVSPGWAIAVGIIAGLVALPVAAIAVLALSAGFETWPHLLRTILPGALATTLMVMAGVAAITLVAGAGTAWIITMYRFPGRGLLDRLLVIPLAVPTYIAAYCYVDLLGYAGPVQGALRAFFEWRTPAGS